MTNSEKIAKLAGRIGAIDEKIANLQTERADYVNQISNELGINGGTPTNKTAAKTGPKGKHSLGDKIKQFISNKPGQTLEEVASALKMASQQVAVSIYHLTKKNELWSDGGRYFVTAPLVGAKTESTDTVDGE